MALNPLIPAGLVGGIVLMLVGSKKASASQASPPPLPTTLPPASGPVVNVPSPAPARKTYTVQSGDYPALIAKAFTGDANRWQELTRANPQKPVWTSGEIAALKKPTPAQTVGNFKTLYAGETLYLPAGW